MQKDVEDGTIIAPAFSSITADDLGRKARLQELAMDLQEAGIDEHLKNHHWPLIRSWLEAVVPEELTESQGVDPGSQGSSLSGTTARQERLDDPSMNEVVKGLDGTSISPLSNGKTSQSKLQKKSNSPWGQVDERKPEDGKKMLTKLLQLKYPTSKGRDLIIKRIFWHLDWLNHGYLHRSEVERHCTPAIKDVIALTEHEVMEMVRLFDPNRDSRIDFHEFLSFCHKLIEVAVDNENKRRESDIKSSSDDAEKVGTFGFPCYPLASSARIGVDLQKQKIISVRNTLVSYDNIDKVFDHHLTESRCVVETKDGPRINRQNVEAHWIPFPRLTLRLAALSYFPALSSFERILLTKKSATGS